MKTIITSLTCLIALHSYSQKQGTILYKESMKMEFQMELDSATKAMLGNLPTETSRYKELSFTEKFSLFQTFKMPEPDKKNEDGNETRRIEIKMDGGNEITFCDFEKKLITEQKDFMGKIFLIDTAFSKSDWKLTGKQKQIQNFPCTQAVKVQKTDTIYAWFTPNIPVSGGPMGINGLPGMVLELNAMNGKLTVVADKIDLTTPVDNKKLIKPKSGKKVKRSEFEKIVEEKRKEMQEESGGKGNVIIKMETR